MNPEALPDYLLGADLNIRPSSAEEARSRASQLAPFQVARVIEVRSSGKVAGILGINSAGLWIDIDPEHRRRGRGLAAFSVWLRAILEEHHEASIPAGISSTAREFLRRFNFSRQADGRWISTGETRSRLAAMLADDERRYFERAQMTLLELGIPADYPMVCGLPVCLEPSALIAIEDDVFGRPQRMHPAAARSWRRMRDAAAEDGVRLNVVSAYRSFDYQAELLRRKLESGQSIAEVLEVSAAPGFSEHHTGRAIDLTTPGSEPLETEFAKTSAFQWLRNHAHEYGFRLSYPENNDHGVTYEPWHWYFRGSTSSKDKEQS